MAQEKTTPAAPMTRAIDRAMTLYEQVVARGGDHPMQDDQYSYITAPVADEAHLTQYFRIGYEPAPDHPMNDGVNVVLRISTERRRALYEEACKRCLAAVQDTSADQRNDAYTQSTAVFGKPSPIDELVRRLPDAEEDES